MGKNKRVAFIGELGLTGYVRGGYMLENKIAEAERLGFDEVIVPNRKFNQNKIKSIKVTKIDHVSELESLFREKP